MTVDRIGYSGDGVDGAEDIGDGGDSDDFGAQGELGFPGIEVETHIVAERNPAKVGSRTLGELLPGDDVGMVLHFGDPDLIIGSDVGIAPSASNHIDRGSGTAGEDDFVRGGSVDEALDGVASRL